MSPWPALSAVSEDANRWTERATARRIRVARRGSTLTATAKVRDAICLEFGEVLYGSVGSTGHRAVTVLGEVVNTATLLERKTRALGMPILMSEALAVALPPARRAALTPLGEVELRRSAPPMAVFGVVS